jgi:hypothetical protein
VANDKKTWHSVAKSELTPCFLDSCWSYRSNSFAAEILLDRASTAVFGDTLTLNVSAEMLTGIIHMYLLILISVSSSDLGFMDLTDSLHIPGTKDNCISNNHGELGC